MKNKIFMTFCLAGFILAVGLVGGWESKYLRVAVCDGKVNETYYFTDLSGHTWAWDADKGETFNLGDEYKLIMDDNHSTSIYDDWIYKIKKI